MTTALIIVDVQNDFCEGGALAVTGGNAVATNLTQFLTHEQFNTVVTTQDWHIDPGTHWADTPDYVNTWPVHCAAETVGADYHPVLAEVIYDYNPIRIFKGQYEAAYSGFEGATEAGEKLADVLRERGVTEVLVTGLATDHCVFATARDALNEGFKVKVQGLLVAGVDAVTSQDRLAELETLGVTVIR